MSKGKNVYDDVHLSFGTIYETNRIMNFAGSAASPCVFLSHKSEDKDAVKAIGEYIKDAGINIYLDAEDGNLQQAVRDGDDIKITKFIERGIQCSTDVMACISERTKGSWWVPYEFGFGKNGGKHLSSMKLKDVVNPPSFLKIVKRLENITDLNNYLKEIKARTPAVELIRNVQDRYTYLVNVAAQRGNILMEANGFQHPLENYLNK